MYSHKVQVSGLDTYKLPVLKEATMRELFKQLRSGKESAREELVNGNLRLVLSVLKRFKNRGEYVDDLFQIGCIGLIKAIDNFDTNQNVNFSTYAVPMIIGEIKRYLRDNSPIRVSRSLKSMGQRIQGIREELSQTLMREPTIEELAEVLETSREEVVLAYNSINDPVSLHDPVFKDASDPVFIMDMIADDASDTEKWLDSLALKEVFAKLSPREKMILEARFFQGRTQNQIARDIGISQAQISRIEKNALDWIKQYFQEEEPV